MCFVIVIIAQKTHLIYVIKIYLSACALSKTLTCTCLPVLIEFYIVALNILIVHNPSRFMESGTFDNIVKACIDIYVLDGLWLGQFVVC